MNEEIKDRIIEILKSYASQEINGELMIPEFEFDDVAHDIMSELNLFS